MNVLVRATLATTRGVPHHLRTSSSISPSIATLIRSRSALSQAVRRTTCVSSTSSATTAATAAALSSPSSSSPFVLFERARGSKAYPSSTTLVQSEDTTNTYSNYNHNHYHHHHQHQYHNPRSFIWPTSVATAALLTATAVTTAVAESPEKKNDKQARPSSSSETIATSSDTNDESEPEKELSLLGRIQAWIEEFKLTLEQISFVLHNPSQFLIGYTLLPDPIEPGIPTLVIDINDLLLIETGEDGQKRALKRPGIEEFLNVVASHYEIILWCTNENVMIDSQNAKKLNEPGIFTAVLWYPDLTMDKGILYKDLGRLNRDLSRTVILVSDPNSCLMHPANAVQIPKWDGNENDTALYDIAVYFQYLGAQPETQDLRVTMAAFRKMGDNLLPFWRNEREKQTRLVKKLEERKGTIWGKLVR